MFCVTGEIQKQSTFVIFTQPNATAVQQLWLYITTTYKPMQLRATHTIHVIHATNNIEANS